MQEQTTQSDSPEQQEHATWRRWVGLQVLSKLATIHVSDQGRRFVERAQDKAYAMIWGQPREAELVVEIEILISMAAVAGWNVKGSLEESRQLLRPQGRKQDPMTRLLAGLAARTELDPSDRAFIEGIVAAQSFYGGDPDPVLGRLAIIALPFSADLDLEVLASALDPSVLEEPTGPTGPAIPTAGARAVHGESPGAAEPVPPRAPPGLDPAPAGDRDEAPAA